MIALTPVMTGCKHAESAVPTRSFNTIECYLLKMFRKACPAAVYLSLKPVTSSVSNLRTLSRF